MLLGRMKELKAFLDDHVRKMYFAFDRGHDEFHYDEVVENTIVLSEMYHLKDYELVALLTAAAYHDCGRLINDQKHEIYSVKIYKNDLYLKSFLNEVFPDLPYKKIISLGSTLIRCHRNNMKAKGNNELIFIIKDSDKVSNMGKDRALYRSITYYMDRKWDGKDVNELISNRIHFFGGKITYTPRSKAMKYMLQKDVIEIPVTPSDIEHMVYKILKEGD